MTKSHSENSVAAKSRFRLERAGRDPVVERVRLRRIRGRAKWRLQLRDLEHVDSLTITLHRLPWPARYVDSDGRTHSAASVGRLVAAFLRDAP